MPLVRGNQRLTIAFLHDKQSHKSFRTKQKLAKAKKQNRPIPQWIRLRTDNTIRYDAPRDSLTYMTGGEEEKRSTRTGAHWTQAWLTDDAATTLSGGTGARLAWASRCIANRNATCCCSSLGSNHLYDIDWPDCNDPTIPPERWKDEDTFERSAWTQGVTWGGIGIIIMDFDDD